MRNLRLRLWLLLRLVVAAAIAFALVGGWTIVERTWLYPYDYRSYIETSAAQQRADPFLVAAVIKHESKFQPTARSDGGAEIDAIPYPETRLYVRRVLEDREQYKRLYDE